MSGARGEAEGSAEVLDAIADVLQAGSPGAVSWIKPPTVVCDAHGQRSLLVSQSERDLRCAAGVFCCVLDRFRAGEVDGPPRLLRCCEARSLRGSRRSLRAPPARATLLRGRSRRAAAGRSRGRCCAPSRAPPVHELPARRASAHERGWGLGILLCERELDDQRHQLVLDPVVQVTLQPPPLVGQGVGGTRSRWPRRLHRLSR